MPEDFRWKRGISQGSPPPLIPFFPLSFSARLNARVEKMFSVSRCFFAVSR
jgi:hypothetical protein